MSKVNIPLPFWPPFIGFSWWYQEAARSFNKWKSFGVSDAFAYGMIAQQEAEASFNPNAKGDKVNNIPTAFGEFQEHMDRVNVIKKGCGIDLLSVPPPSIEKQIEAAWWELNNIEKKALEKIKAALTAHDAGVAACTFFERAGAKSAAERRGLMADRWLEYFTSNPDMLTNNPPKD